MQMDASLQRLHVRFSVRRKVKTHSAYIKDNNGKLSATQPTKAAINITKTLTTTGATTALALALKSKIKLHSSLSSSSAVRRIRFTLNVLSHEFFAVAAALTLLLQHCWVGCCSLLVIATFSPHKTEAILKRTQTHLPLALSLRLAAGKSHLPQALHTPTTMGSCFGRCVSKDANGGGAATTATSCLW